MTENAQDVEQLVYHAYGSCATIADETNQHNTGKCW